MIEAKRFDQKRSCSSAGLSVGIQRQKSKTDRYMPGPLPNSRHADLLDQEFLDLCALFHFRAEPARHATATRPRFARIVRIGVLGRHRPALATTTAEDIADLEAGVGDHG